MSKLAGGLTGTKREDLEALVAMGDTSVPGIEATDINDGDILAATRENVNSNGQMQFVYIPADGEPITSDWISQEHKKKSIMPWVDGVKAALISRSQAVMRAANEAQLKKRQEEQMTAVEAMTAQVAVQERSAAARTPRSDNDPSAYIEDQLNITRERLRAAEEAQNDIIREVLAARRDYDKWSKLSAALNGDSNSGGRGSDVNSLNAAVAAVGTSQYLRGPAGTAEELPGVRTQRQVHIPATGRT
jgi:hypothetical protein